MWCGAVVLEFGEGLVVVVVVVVAVVVAAAFVGKGGCGDGGGADFVRCSYNSNKR